MSSLLFSACESLLESQSPIRLHIVASDRRPSGNVETLSTPTSSAHQAGVLQFQGTHGVPQHRRRTSVQTPRSIPYVSWQQPQQQVPIARGILDEPFKSHSGASFGPEYSMPQLPPVCEMPNMNSATVRTAFVHSPYTFDGPQEISLPQRPASHSSADGSITPEYSDASISSPEWTPSQFHSEPNSGAHCMEPNFGAFPSHMADRLMMTGTEGDLPSTPTSSCEPINVDGCGCQCPHPKQWKRLRAKRQFVLFSCNQCHLEWRVPTRYLNRMGYSPHSEVSIAQC